MSSYLSVLPFVKSVQGPDGVGQLDIYECGSLKNMCLCLCVSVALTGSPNAAPLLRRLTCAALIAYYNELNTLVNCEPDARNRLFNAAEFLDTIKEEINRQKTVGCDATIQCIHALSAALGVRIQYTKPAQASMPDPVWNFYDPSNKSSDRAIYIWATVGHYQLAIPAGWQCMWDHPDRRDIVEEIVLLIDKTERAAAAFASTHAAINALWSNLETWWSSDTAASSKRLFVDAYKPMIIH